jgi:hypothetical protein
VANSPMLLNKGCIYKSAWKSYWCPWFAEGYGLMLVTDMVRNNFFTINSNNKTGIPNATDAYGVTHALNLVRNIYGTWTQLGKNC